MEVGTQTEGRTEEEAPATTIDNLLPDVLIEIFEKLDEDSDLRNVQQVCHLWSVLVDKRVGIKVCVGRRVYYHDFKRVELEQLCQIGVKCCFILIDENQSEEDSGDDESGEESGDQSVHESDDESDEETGDENEQEIGERSEADSEDEWENQNENKEEHQNKAAAEHQVQNPLEGGLKYPYLLKDLYLYGTVPSDVFIKLVEHARNLSYLEIALCTLSKLRHEDLKNLKVTIPKLKELNLARDAFPGVAGIAPNLKTFLTENRFPGLTSLRIDVLRGPLIDLSMTGTLIAFVQDHRALRTLHVCMVMDNEVGENDIIPASDPELKRTVIAGIQRRGDCHLRDLAISTYTNEPHPTDGFPFPGPIEIIKEFLLHVVTLERLRMDLGPIPNSTLQAICTRNADTLAYLAIHSYHSAVDCSVFSSLQADPAISIYCRDHGANELSRLPPTLTRISIWGAIQQADAEHILFNLPNIRAIGLYSKRDPRSPRDGACVTLDMLRRFAQNRKVGHLQVFGNCLADGEELPREVIPNNDANNPEMLMVLDYNKKLRLGWKLNEAGFYTNGWDYRPIEN